LVAASRLGFGRRFAAWVWSPLRGLGLVAASRLGFGQAMTVSSAS
jgi:hypothetical protein